MLNIGEMIRISFVKIMYFLFYQTYPSMIHLSELEQALDRLALFVIIPGRIVENQVNLQFKEVLFLSIMTESYILQVGAEMGWLGQLKMNRSGLSKTKQQTDIEPHQPSFQLVFEKDRLETFKENWKELKGFKNCTPENFAAAGFYNLNVSNKNISDTVKCFSCQKELSDWEKEDDPWLEHVKRGTKCPFVLFKSKEKTTVKDFLELQYETKKILLENYFEEQKQILQEKEKEILKTITNKQKRRR